MTGAPAQPQFLSLLFDCLDCEKTFRLTPEGCGGTVRSEDDRVEGFLCHDCYDKRIETGAH